MDYRLEDRAVIAVAGPEARDFLQGLLTNDVKRSGGSSLTYAALLTPQGKILFDVLISAEGDSLFLDCRTELREALLKRLTLYRLRAKVDVVARDDRAVAWRDREPIDAPFRPDPRHPALGARAIVPITAAPHALGADAYRTARLRAGVPEGPDFGQDKIFALDSGLDELHGIAFDKGCYVGQELTARMKHRGTARKRLLPVASSSGKILADLGAEVTAGAREIGSLQASYGKTGFALVRLDRLAEAQDMPLRIADTVVTIEKPAWLFS